MIYYAPGGDLPDAAHLKLSIAKTRLLQVDLCNILAGTVADTFSAPGVDAQIQYRPPDPPWPERICDPEIRHSFKLPDTELWKSGTVTTGRGLLDSISRKIAELEDDARYRDNVAETKRRQIEELTGLQGRSFTHAQELAQSRTRLEELKAELERSTNRTTKESERQAIADGHTFALDEATLPAA